MAVADPEFDGATLEQCDEVAEVDGLRAGGMSETGVRLRDLGAGYWTAGALHRLDGRCAGRSVGV
jgi:hypothetical protein